MSKVSDPISFATADDWNIWLAAHHATTREVWVLYYKKGGGVASIDWTQAVIEALAYGWIDGIRNTVDERCWKQRFTPRKAGSNWSKINCGHAERLISEGRMRAAGLAQVEIARANGRWAAAYSGGQGAEIAQDLLDAIATGSAAQRQSFAALGSRERFAIYYRLATAKRAETRAKRFADILVRLELGKSIL